MTTIVTLLTEDDCKLCDRASAVLERVAADFEFELHTVDLATPEGTALATSIGLARAPAVLLDGVAFSSGRLSARQLRRELTRRAAVAAAPLSPAIAGVADPETPEAELSGAERRTERRRLRAVRKERRRQAMTRKKESKNNKKDAKKERKGKRR